MSPKAVLIDHTGQVFNRLTVIERAEENGSKGMARWVCKCACGRVVTVRGDKLRDGVQQSCGCLQVEQNWERHQQATGKRHGWRGEAERRRKFRREHGWDE